MPLPKQLLERVNAVTETLRGLAAARAQGGEASGEPSWTPFPGPQTNAFNSTADEIFYGGAAGGGKTGLLVGLALFHHRRSIIFRKTFSELDEVIEQMRVIGGERVRVSVGLARAETMDGRVIKLGYMEHEKDKEKYRGRPNDGIFIDEAPLFSRSQVEFVCGWNRTTIPGQRLRIILTGNPPTDPQQEWIIEAFAPWLREGFPDPAEPGELRWYSMVDGKLTWFKTGEPFEHVDAKTGDTETIIPRSRTFFPATLKDNPLFADGRYQAVIQGKPEPLRSQLLYGDFKAGLQDDAWQVIPTEWVRAAQRRWTDTPPREARLTSVGVDVAAGGSAKTIIARVFNGHWFAPLQKHPGESTPDGVAVASLVKAAVEATSSQRRQGVAVNFDCIGVGAGLAAAGKLLGMHYLVPVDFRAGGGTDASGNMKFVNLRAWAYWHLRDLLNPDREYKQGEQPLALPPDNELLADLTAPRWAARASGVVIEEKKEIQKRIGRSTDCGDAVVYACVPTVAGGIAPQWL